MYNTELSYILIILIADVRLYIYIHIIYIISNNYVIIFFYISYILISIYQLNCQILLENINF